jgi:hypothetical protein
LLPNEKKLKNEIFCYENSGRNLNKRLKIFLKRFPELIPFDESFCANFLSLKKKRREKEKKLDMQDLGILNCHHLELQRIVLSPERNENKCPMTMILTGKNEHFKDLKRVLNPASCP